MVRPTKQTVTIRRSITDSTESGKALAGTYGGYRINTPTRRTIKVVYLDLYAIKFKTRLPCNASNILNGLSTPSSKLIIGNLKNDSFICR